MFRSGKSVLVLSCALALGLSACGRQAAQAPGAARGSVSGPTSVVARPATLTDFAYETEALGTAKANEAVDITAKATNRVIAFHFREGQQMKKGAVLVEFDGNEARANLAAAEAALKDSKSQFDRSRELYNSKALSASQLEQLEATMMTNRAQVDAARAKVNDTIILAPFSGRVGLRNVSVGSLVTPGQIITTLDDTNIIKLDFTVPEIVLASLAAGQTVEAKSAAYSDEVFRGRIVTIGTRVDTVSRSATVRALIDNYDQRLKPGMFMTVHVTRPVGKVLMIPEQALIPESDRQYVFVVYDGIAKQQQITIGRRRPGEVEVLTGLSAGDLVVVEGGENLREGAAVRVTAPASNPQQGAASKTT